MCRRREQKELKVPQIQNSFSVVEQMFERRASGSRRAFLAESFFFFFLVVDFSSSFVFEEDCSDSGCPSPSLADAGGLLNQAV